MNRAFHIAGVTLLLSCLSVYGLSVPPLAMMLLGAMLLAGLVVLGRKKELPLWCYAGATALCAGGLVMAAELSRTERIYAYADRPTALQGLVVEQDRGENAQTLEILLGEGSPPELVGERFSLGTSLSTDILPGEIIAFTVTPERGSLRSLGGGEALLGGYLFNEPAVVGEDQDHWQVRLEQWRREIANRLYRLLPQEEGRVMGALVTAKGDGITPRLRSAFQRAGFSHFLAMSGQHLSIMLGIMGSVLGLMLPRRNWRVLGELMFTLALMGLSGFSPSMLRAGFMVSVSRAGTMLGRQSDGLNNLGLAAVIILLYDPAMSHSLSFLLSYLSTMGILTLHRPLCRMVVGLVPRGDFDALRDARPGVAAAVEVVMITPAAMSLTLPLTGWYFGAMTPVAVLSGPLAYLPMTGSLFFAMLAALVVLLPGELLLWPARVLAWCSGVCIRAVEGIAQLADKLPGSVVAVDQVMVFWEVAMIACLLFLWYNGQKKIVLYGAFGLGLCVLSTVRLAAVDLWEPPLVVSTPMHEDYVVLTHGRQAVVLGLPKDETKAVQLWEQLRLQGVTEIGLLVTQEEAREDPQQALVQGTLEAAAPVRTVVSLDGEGQLQVTALNHLVITEEDEDGVRMDWGEISMVKTFDQSWREAHMLINSRSEVIVAEGLPVIVTENANSRIWRLYLPKKEE